jgi:thymidylate synthase (FAD)
MKVLEQSVELLKVDANATLAIEEAGRTCYKSEDKITETSAKDFVGMLVMRKHGAMLEFADATFRIITDRGISHEMVRHRLASFAQESTRYCNYSKDRFGKELTFIEPPGMDTLTRAYWVAACTFAENEYFSMLNSGAKPEIARSVLPTCIKTEIVMKANFREWLHFIELRTAPAAHPQIREIAREINNILHAHTPEIFTFIPKEKNNDR